MSRGLPLALLLLSSLGLSADTVRLKNGGTLEGVVLKDVEGSLTIRLKYATVTVDKVDILAVEKSAPAAPGPEKNVRLVRWEKCLEIVAARPWARELQEIPATVIDKGVLKHVPYMSHKSDSYEFNIYGDPDDPAGLEIGISKELLKNKGAKKECVEVMALLLGDHKDVEILRSLKLATGKMDRDGLTFEITPETAEDAYGGWWVSIYDIRLLESQRASAKELEEITVQRAEVVKEDEEWKKTRSLVPPEKRKAAAEEEAFRWTPRDLGYSRPPPTTNTGPVYVKGYFRKGGTYVRPHTRSRPRR